MPSHSHRSRHHGKLLGYAFWLIAGFALVELVVAYFGNSLALAADAGHMLLDASALGLSWSAIRLSQRGHDSRLTYGYHRFEVLAAFVNGLALLALCGWILFEALGRLRAPEAMLPVPVLIAAAVGFVVNGIAYRLLHGADNVNVQSAALHVLGDLLGSAAAMLSALAVLLLGWGWADPLLALAVVAILLRGAWRVLRDSANILLEASPRNIDIEELRRALTQRVPQVQAVHHVHAWALTGDRPLLTLHAVVPEDAEADAASSAIKRVLAESFGIEHSTVQIERGDCPDEPRGHDEAGDG